MADAIVAPVGLDGKRPLLEPDVEEMKALIDGAASRVFEYLQKLPEVKPLAKVSYPDTDLAAASKEVSALVEETLPEEPVAYSELLNVLFDDCLSAGINTAHPGYLGHIGGGGLYHAAVADFISAAVNRQMAVWQCCPGFVRLEMNVLRWFCSIAELPQTTSFGVLTSGGSTATLSAIVAARTAKLPEEFTRGCIYASSQVHHCVTKAAVIAGFPARRVRLVPVDAHMRIRMDELRRMVADDRSNELLPFLVVPNAGSTNTGAVDDLEACADLCASEGLWMHTDAAYGFFFAMTDLGRSALKGMGRSDSITLDPHKGLGLPYGTGCLLVRDYAQLKHAHHGGERGAYMPQGEESGSGGLPTLVDFTAASPELSSGFRGLRIWLPMKLYGAGAFRANAEENLTNARWVTEELRDIIGIEIVTEPQLSILTFSVKVGERTLEEVNAGNKALLQGINSAGHVFISPTDLDGRFVLRVAVSSFRTHRANLEALVRDVREIVRGTVGSA